MPLKAEKLWDRLPSRQARGYSTVEPWEVFPVDAGGAFDPLGNVEPDNILDPSLPAVQGLPIYGQAHAVIQYGLVVDIRVSQIVSKLSVIVLVFYRSYGLFTGGPRPISDAYNATRMVALPVWNQRTDGVITYWVEDDSVMYPRMVSIRSETRWIPGSAVTAVQNAVAINAGTLWTIDGLIYRLSDRTRARYDGNTYTRADYRFERDCEIRAIPADAGGALFGNGVAIPFLPALYVYSSRPDAVSSGNPPQIRAVPPPADFGGPAHTPPYPALPGFP